MKKTIIIVLIFVSLFLLLSYRTKHTVSQNEKVYEFTIESGDDIITVGRKLAKQDLIANRIYFYYYAWKNKLRGSLKAGKYAVPPNSTIADIVYRIFSGDALVEKKKQIKITFPEGWMAKQMAQRLNKNNLPGDDFLKLTQNPTEELYEKYPFLPKGKSLEGYLFPDTYFFLADTTAIDIVEKMLDNFNKKVVIGRGEAIKQTGKTLDEIIILASIVEGEVPIGGERNVIAGIFQNRLDVGMALQSDATIDYIKGTPEIKHTKEDISIDSPYNTYMYPGLPPGPINNPSLEAIDAVIAPADTDYMYFLNNAKTGETVFSKTLDEHNVNKSKNGL